MKLIINNNSIKMESNKIMAQLYVVIYTTFWPWYFSGSFWFQNNPEIPSVSWILLLLGGMDRKESGWVVRMGKKWERKWNPEYRN